MLLFGLFWCGENSEEAKILGFWFMGSSQSDFFSVCLAS